MTNNAILVVDDNYINREVLASLFENEYEILRASEGDEAMRVIEENKDRLALVLLDLMMPKKNGYEVLDFMNFRRIKQDIPVIAVTSPTDELDKQKMERLALEKNADDLVTKPIEPDIVQKRAANMIELYRFKRSLQEMIDQRTDEVRQSSEFVMEALMMVMQAKRSNSRTSVLRIRDYTRALLEYMAVNANGFYDIPPEQISLITTASLLHDIGEVAVPESIFEKQPFLTPAEQRLLESHTERGCDIIGSMRTWERGDYVQTALDICRWHHERWDGSGYPDHLVGEDIPLSAQVVGFADTYEGLRSGTLTGREYTHEDALYAIENGDFGGFSPILTECCKSMGPEFSDIHDQFDDSLRIDF